MSHKFSLRYYIVVVIWLITLFFSQSALCQQNKKIMDEDILVEDDQFIQFKAKTLDKKRINTESFAGKKIIVLKFGSIYCSSCISSIPKLAKIQDKYKADLKLIEVNLDIYGRGRVRKFYRGLKDVMNYPVVIDRGLNISRRYGVTTLPTNVVIDKKGIIRYISRGYSENEEENLEEVISSILGTKKVSKKVIRRDKISILMPLNITKTYQDEIFVVGRVTTPGVKVVMSLNGGSLQSQVTTKEMFYFRTLLTLGSNYIEVKIPAGKESEDSKAIVIFRENKFDLFNPDKKPVPFPEYKFHTKTNEAECGECHELIPPQTDEDQPQMITSFCLKCHEEMTAEKYVHGPISVGGCLPCHDFKSTPNRYELFEQGADLCYNCHFDKKEELELRNLHGPMAAGICVLCHNPHSAPFKFQLQRWGGELCYFCHSDLRRYQASASQHKPFRDGECTACHNPHSSNSMMYFLKKDYTTDLCYTCHKKEDMKDHRHPVGIKPTRVKLPASRRLDKKGRLICTTCHNPHGDDSPRMLPKEGCAGCHSQASKTTKKQVLPNGKAPKLTAPKAGANDSKPKPAAQGKTPADEDKADDTEGSYWDKFK